MHQEAQARAAGFKIDEVVSDEGVSGIRVPLRERAEGRRLFELLRAGDTQLADDLGHVGVVAAEPIDPADEEAQKAGISRRR